MARTKKVEVWLHFESGKVKCRHHETCKNREAAELLIRLEERQHQIDASEGYKPFTGTYSIEPYGTMAAVGQIVYR